jgi:uncharacterized protein (UPF0332 family)
MNVSFRDWQGNGWVRPRQTSPEEIRNLLAIAQRDLQDASTSGLSADWRLSIAYNAALQLAAAALAACGYRAARESHHYRLIQSLRLTLGLEEGLIRQLDALRQMRNVLEYERARAASEQDAEDMLRLAKHLRAKVSCWLRAHHPALLESSDP